MEWWNKDPVKSLEVKKNQENIGMGTRPLIAANTWLFLVQLCRYNKTYPARAWRREAEPFQFYPTFPNFEISTWKEFEQIPTTSHSVQQQ